MAIFTQLLESKRRPIWAAESPEPALFGPLAIPVVVAGEIDVLPSEWREVLRSSGSMVWPSLEND